MSEVIINFAEDILVNVRNSNEVAVELSYQGPQGSQGPMGDVTPAAIAARDAANAARDAAIAERVLAESASDTAIDARDATVEARDLALSHKGAAQTAKTAAEVAQGAAETARDGSISAKNSAETARNKAQEWAEKAEDSLVETGAYSAKHHAAKAAASASAASTSKTDATTAKNDAQAARNKAQEWAEKAEDAAVEAGLYSAKHHAAKAAAAAAIADGHAADALTHKNNAEQALSDLNDAIVDLGVPSAHTANAFLQRKTDNTGFNYVTAAQVLETIGGDDASKLSKGTVPDARLPTRLQETALDAKVEAAITAVIGGAPEALDNIRELAEAIGEDPNFAVTVSNQIASKFDANKVSTFIETLLAATNEAAARAAIGAQVALSSVTKAEAEAGTVTTDRTWSAARVREAIAAYASALGHEHVISDITGLQTALDGKQASGSYEPARTAVEQAEAEAGTDTTVRGWTALRVRQAISAYAMTKTLLSGGSETVLTDDSSIVQDYAGRLIVANKATALTLTLDTPANLGENWLAIIANKGIGDLTVVGSFDDGETEVRLETGGSMMVQSNGTTHRTFLRGGGAGGGGGSVVPLIEDGLGSGTGTINLVHTPASKDAMTLFIGGVPQRKSKFTLAGNVITLLDGATIATDEYWMVTMLKGGASVVGVAPLHGVIVGDNSVGPYVLPEAPISNAALTIEIDGVSQPRDGSAYTISGKNITFSESLSSDMTFTYTILRPVGVGEANPDSIRASHIDGSDATAIRSKLGLGSDSISANISSGTFTGNGTAGPYTLPASAVSKEAIIELLIGGYPQATSAIASVSGTQLTMSEAIPNGVVCFAKVITQVAIGTPSDDTIIAAHINAAGLAALQTRLGVADHEVLKFRFTIPTEADLNAYFMPGMYRQSSNVSAAAGFNYPVSQAGLLTVYGSGIEAYSLITQEYVVYNTGERWQRHKYTSWTPWVRVYSSSNIVGAVTQSSSVPTGAIIEKGSNSNGEYTKFADGTLICRLGTTLASFAVNATYGNLLYQGSYVWTYPATFVVEPIPTCGMFKWGSGGSWGTIAASNISSVSLRCLDTASRAAGSTELRATAIGRWY